MVKRLDTSWKYRHRNIEHLTLESLRIHRNLDVSLSSKETAKDKKKQEKKSRDDESARLACENKARHKAEKAERIRVQGEVAANLMAEKARLVLEGQHLVQLQVEANRARLAEPASAESASTSRPPSRESREAAVQEKLALDPANGEREQWIKSRTNGELRRVDLINKELKLLIEVKTYKNRVGVFEQITNYHKILSEKGVTIRTLRIHFFDVLSECENRKQNPDTDFKAFVDHSMKTLCLPWAKAEGNGVKFMYV